MAQSELPPGVSEQDMALVKGIDNLCTTLYSTPDESARKSADEQLARVFYDAGVGQSSASKAYTVVVSADGIKSSAVAADIKAVPLHEKMLSLSSCGFTLHFSSRALLIIVSNCWQVLDAQQRLQLRDFAFNCFVAKGPRVPKLAVNALITLTCRITKRGWCESPQYHQVVAEMMQLLPSQDPFYRQLGLRFLSELIEEMQAIRIQGHLRSGRAAAIAFRDQGLRDIFTSVKRLLQDLSAEACDIEEYSDEEAFLQLTLETLLACLSYDFDVSNPDRSNDDLSITRVPRAWSDTRDETTIGLFFEIYQARPGTRCASLALECVGKLASLRRSLFSKDERMALVQRLQRETLMIMGSSQGMDDEENFHSFCRLLGSMKLSFNLEEVVSTDAYSDWVAALLTFSKKSFAAWNTVHDAPLGYLMSLWGALVTPLIASDNIARSGEYIRNTTSSASRLGEIVPELVSTFVESRMALAQALAHAKCGVQGGEQYVSLENPLEQEGSPAQLLPLEKLCWLRYSDCAKYLTDLLERTTVSLVRAASATGQPGVPQQQLQQAQIAVAVEESKMSWLVQIAANIIGAFAGSIYTRQTVPDSVNANLAATVFRILILVCPHCVSGDPGALQHAHAHCGAGTSGALPPSPMREGLELSFLEFIDQFRRLHVNPPGANKGKVESGNHNRRLGLLALASRMPRAGKALMVRSIPSSLLARRNGLASGVVDDNSDSSLDSGDSSDDSDDGMAGQKSEYKNANLNKPLANEHTQGDEREENTYAMLVRLIHLQGGNAGSATVQANTSVANSLSNGEPIQNQGGGKQHVAVLDLIIAKLAFNLRSWAPDKGNDSKGTSSATSRTVAKRTLLLLHTMAVGVRGSVTSSLRSTGGKMQFSTGKMLLQSRVLCNLLANANINNISYFCHPKNGSERTVFFNALMHILCMQMVNTPANARFMLFMRFVSPLEKVMAAMIEFASKGNNLRNPGIRDTLSSWCRDVLGICTAAKTRHTYSLVFEWLVPAPSANAPGKMQLLAAALKSFADDPYVTTPILKLVSDVVYNCGHRVSFPPASADGYVLCRYAATCISRYCEALSVTRPGGGGAEDGQQGPNSSASVFQIGMAPGQDRYKMRYKGLGFCMHAMARILNGNYVNFGIMQLYGDKTLSNARDALLQLALSADPRDLLSYPKTSLAFFLLMDALAIKDIHAIVNLPTQLYFRLLESIMIVIQRPVEEAAFAASVIDRIMTYRFDCEACVAADQIEHASGEGSSKADASTVQHRAQKHDAWSKMQQHEAAHPNALVEMLKAIFQLVAFQNCTRQWSMSRPLLPLILSLPAFWDKWLKQIIAEQPPQRQQQFAAAFAKLSDGIDRTLATKNRDRFTKQLYNAVRLIKS